MDFISSISNSLRYGAIQATNSRYKVFLLLLAGTLLLRGQLLFTYELDHDVSTYSVMANEWLKGHLPFVDYVDVKPIGIYAIFASAIFAFGNTLIAARILAILFIAGTGFNVYRILIGFNRSQVFSLGSGLLFLLLASLHKWSWASNTEIFFVFFTSWGAFKILNAKRNTDYLWFGFACGLGFIIKYHVLFDYTALGVFWLILSWKHESIKTLFYRLGSSFAAFLLPFALVNFFYWVTGNYSSFLEVSFGIPSRYSNNPGIIERLQFLGEFYLAFLPLSILLIIGFLDSEKDERISLLSGIWIIMVWLAIFATGKSFFHYYYQALLPLSIFALEAIRIGKHRSIKILRRYAWLFLSLGVLGSLIAQYSQLKSRKHDPVISLERDLKNKIKAGDRIYIQKKNILYFTLDKSPIEKFVHNTLMFNQDHIDAFGISLKDEYDRIKEVSPNFIVIPETGNAYLDNFISENFKIDTVYSPNLVLWTKNN